MSLILLDWAEQLICGGPTLIFGIEEVSRPAPCNLPPRRNVLKRRVAHAQDNQP